jgi:hypothetical protein
MLAGAAMGLSSLTVVLNADLACGLDKSALTRRAFERLRLATLGSCGSPLRAHAPCATRIAPRSSGQPEPGPSPLHAFRCGERLAATASSWLNALRLRRA